MEMMAAEGSSEEWVQTEIARQLEQLSLEDLEEEETATENGAHSPPSSQEEDKLMVSSLFQSYLHTLHSQHIGTDGLLSDIEGALKSHTRTESSHGVANLLDKTCVTCDVEIHSPPESDNSLLSREHLSGTVQTQEMVLLEDKIHDTNDEFGGNLTTVQVQERYGELAGEQVREGDVLVAAESVKRCASESEGMRDVLALNTSGDGQAELQAALRRLEEEERERNENLLKEQQEREAALNLMVEESEKLQKEQEKISAERAERERIRRSSAVVLLQAYWRGSLARRLYCPQLRAMRHRRLQEQQKERELELQRVRRREEEAARVIQSHWRGHRCRRNLNLWRKNYHQKQLDIESREHTGSFELSAPTVTLTESALPHHPTLSTGDHALTVTNEQVFTVNNEQTFSVNDDQTTSVTGEQSTSQRAVVADELVETVMTMAESGADMCDSIAHMRTGEPSANTCDNATNTAEIANLLVPSPCNTADTTDTSSTGIAAKSSGCNTADTTDTSSTGIAAKSSPCNTADTTDTSSTGIAAKSSGCNTADTTDTSSTGIAAKSSPCNTADTTDTADKGSTGIATQSSSINTTNTADTTVKGSTDVATTSVVSSPGKFTVTRRIQSALKLREKTSSLEDEPQQGRLSSDSGTAVTNPVGTARYCVSPEPDRAKTSTSVVNEAHSMVNLSEVQRQETSEEKEKTRADKTIKEKERCKSEHNMEPGKVGTTADLLPRTRSVQEMYSGVSASRKLPSESFEDEEGEGADELLREQRALAALVESREREELMAQMSRERMNKMVTAEELAQVAKTKQSHSSYLQELEHASSPLSARAWLGVVRERQEEWRKSHTPWREPRRDPKCPRQNSSPLPKLKSSVQPRPLSDIQLMAASPPGTELDQVTEVIVYRSRAPVDLRCLSHCSHLLSLSLTKCGITSLSGMSGSRQLREITMQCNGTEHVDCSGLSELCFMDLGDNRLASIHGFEECRSLLELNLAENRIARIGGLSGCPRLQKLIVDGNLLISSKGLEDTPLLQFFSCSENHLPKVEGMNHTPLLQHLCLSQNNLQEIPSLPSHVLLRELRLDENSLSSVSPIATAWLPLLQTLTLANNCITQLDSLVCLLMLQTLDISNNSLYDLPGMLQCLRGCYNLRRLHCHGNPVTEEPKYRSHLLKALPHLQELDNQELRKTKTVFPEAIFSSSIYQLCKRQSKEQDKMKERHQGEIDTLLDSSTPEAVEQLLNCRVSHCVEFQELLVRHLREQETFEEEERKSTTKSSSPSRQSSIQPASASTISASSTTPLSQTASSTTPLSQTASSTTPLSQTASSTTPLSQTASSTTPLSQTASSTTPLSQTASSTTPLSQTATEIKASSSTTFLSQAASVIQAAWRGWRVRQCLCRRSQAAVRIQAVWRGYITRRLLLPGLIALLRRRHQAATVIQAYYRGYRLRRRLCAVLERAHHTERTEREEDEEEVDYEEEIKLDYLDESLLDRDLRPFSPKSPLLLHPTGTPTMLATPTSHTVTTVPTYAPPGMADTEIPLEQWKQENSSVRWQRNHIPSFERGFGSGNYTSPPTHLLPVSDTDPGVTLPHPLPGIRPPDSLPKAQPAWESTTQLPETEVRDSLGWSPADQSSGTMEDGRTSVGSTSVCVAGGCGLVNSSKRDQIASEWGFKNSTTADLILKRQKRFKSNTTKRKKLANPSERLALFQKHRELGKTSAVVSMQRRATRVDYFQAHSVKSSPSPDPDETQTKDELVYRWVHDQRIVHKGRTGGGGGGRRAEVKEVEVPSGSRNHPIRSKSRYTRTSSSCSLPQMEPHVLAGHTARLVSSDAQNWLVEEEHPRNVSQGNQLKAWSTNDYQRGLQDTRISSSSFPSMHTSNIHNKL